MIKYLTDLAKALNPHIADTPEQLFAWRQTVAIALLVSLMLHAADFTKSYGGLEWMGVSGFAKADDVSELQHYFKDSRLTQLEEQIDRVRIRQCTASKTGNQAAMSDANYDLNRLTRMYRSTAGYEYRVKSCDELLAAG